MTGVELIAVERQEQIEKHGWSLKHDMLENGDGGLKWAACALLTGDFNYWPENWDPKWINKLSNKSCLDTLIIAGALIAAEIDRIQMDQKSESHV